MTEPAIGRGQVGYIDEYFYDFEADIYVEFYRYDNISFPFSYQQYSSLYLKEPPILTLRSFPEYLVEITPGAVEHTVRSRIDSLSHTAVIKQDSVTIHSTQYKHVQAMHWDLDAIVDLQRYKPINSDWQFADRTVLFADTLDEIAYSAVVDTPLIESGIMFVDRAEWVDTTYTYSSGQNQYSHVFVFFRDQIGMDSLMYRINCDCNDNGIWDAAESVDTGNGIWDPAEPFHDQNGNGIRNSSEPYEDRNCNNTWDPAESFTDTNANGVWDPGEPFTDRIGRLDADEIFTDLNQNGTGDPGELFRMGRLPNHLLTTWTDSMTATVLLNLIPGDSLVTRWGDVYTNILTTVTFRDTQSVLVDDIDSLVVLYTNEIIEHVVDGSGDGDYYITKTEWEAGNTSGGTGDDNYDYLLFKLDGHLYKLVHPSYFKPYGYYWQPSQRETGFWHKRHAVDEVLYYTANGQIRDGERVEEAYFDTTVVAIYKIEKSFAVDADTVTVPAKQQRGFMAGGRVYCYADTGLAVATIEQCPAMDTTFVECFRITRELTMTMIGNGVEYGERNISWLVKGFGLVKDELYIRWTEPMGFQEIWSGYSRWEMGRFSASAGGSRELDRILNRAHILKLSEFDQVAELDGDPYRIHRTAGLQRVELPR